MKTKTIQQTVRFRKETLSESRFCDFDIQDQRNEWGKKWKTLLLTLNTRLSTRSSLAQPKRLRWWISPNKFDKYFSRGTLLATLASAACIFGCNSATSSEGKEFIGVWQKVESPHLTMTITRKGDQFVIQRTEFVGGDQTYLATVHNGMLQLASGDFYTYDKAIDTIETAGVDNNKIHYQRKQ